MQDASSKQQTKQKYKPNHQQTGVPISLSLAHQRKNTQTKTQHKSHPILSLHKPLDHLGRAETKRKREFNLEAWEKDTSNTVSLKKKEKTEKYYTNEGTN